MFAQCLIMNGKALRAEICTTPILLSSSAE